MPEYLDDWIESIEDRTDLVKRVGDLVARGATQEATKLLPDERPYPIPLELQHRLGMTVGSS